MQMDNEDLRFANEVRAAIEDDSPIADWRLVQSLLLILFITLAWAAFAELEEVTTGEGKVIPSRQIQVVQRLESGIVSEILIDEGAIVDKGQTLMRVNDIDATSRLGEFSQRQNSLVARIRRLQAEATGQAELKYPEAMLRSAPITVGTELNLFAARSDKLKADIAVVAQQLLQRKQEQKELISNQEKLTEVLKYAEKEMRMISRLFKKGAIPEIELIQLKRSLAERRGELKNIKVSAPRILAAISEAEKRLQSVNSAFQAEARDELTKSQTELSVIKESMKAANNRVGRAELRSPVRGIINKLNVTTVGAVVQPGQNIIEIVPLDDTMLIEAQIRPKDVAFIHPDQPASVKITAYDYTIYGALKGKVERISADTITDENQQTFYRVIVRTKENKIIHGSKELPIIPGMVATVDIQSGTKTVLDYLLKPIRKARQEALRER